MSLTQPSPARLGLLLILLAALFGAALAIGKATASSGGTSAPMPIELHQSSSGAAVTTTPPAAPALPALRQKPAPAAHSSAPASSAPASSSPSQTAPSSGGSSSGSGSGSGSGGGSGGSGGGSGGSGGVIISG